MYTPSRLHKKISIYTIMDPSTETNIPVEVVPVAEPESVEPVAEPVPEPEVDSPNVLDLSDYTTPEYLEMVKKLIEPSEIETETVEMSKKTFKIPGYTSIQLSNTSKQPRRKSMTFM